MCASVFAAAHDKTTKFLENYGISLGSSTIFNGSTDSPECKNIDEYFLCYSTKNINSFSGKISLDKIFKIESLRVHHVFCIELLKRIRNVQKQNNLRDLNQVAEILNTEKIFSGVEHTSFQDSNLVVTIYLKKINEIESKILQRIIDPEFVKSYCLSMLDVAMEKYKNKQYAESLADLQEIHKLNYPNFTSYYLTALCFYELGKKVESLKIAKAIAVDYIDIMTSENAEQLGDLFMKLHEEKSAERMYILASKKMLQGSDSTLKMNLN